MAATAAAAALYLAAAAQTSIAYRLRIGPAEPDFVLILVVCIGLLRGPTTGTWAGFGGGLWLGLLRGEGLAGLAIGNMLAGALAGRQRRRLRIEHWLAAPLTTLWLTFVASLVACLLSRPGLIGHALKIAAPSAVYNAALSLVVFALTRWVDRRLHPEEA
jgi:rod shape-determining protein MreD